MGARIEGIGTSMLSIEGVERLHGATIEIGTDYHEVTTFLALGAITGGDVRVEKVRPPALRPDRALLRQARRRDRARGRHGLVAARPEARVIERPTRATCCRRSRPPRGRISRSTSCRS
jgi:UDP-N-acetylglucosamine enolpyruvyl transferase